MSKELPYFRFTASEWLNDDISLESYEIKGVFADVCAYYWFKDCSVTKAMLEKRFSDATLMIKQLFESGIIKFKNGDDYIEINFLNSQFDILSESRKRRQDAGSKGGKKKRSNAKARLKQSPSYKDKDKDKDKDDIKDSGNKFSAPIKQDFVNNIIQEFKRVYEEANELPYAIINKGKERSAVGKLLKEFKTQHPDSDSEETFKSLSKYFDMVVNINDTWLRTNMSLTMLMSKFNEINNILRNGKRTGKTGGSDKEFLAVLSKHTT